nr:PqqD family peptide modification chaperone [uncultured Rhodoferax sp.]
MTLYSGSKAFAPISQHGGLTSWLVDGYLLLAEFPQRHLRIYNPTAAALWLLLADGSNNQAELVAAFAELFKQPKIDVEQDVLHLLATWREAGWIDFNETGQLILVSPTKVAFDSNARPNCQYLPTHDIIFDKVYSLGPSPFRVRIGKTSNQGNNGLAERVMALLQGFKAATVKNPPSILDIIVSHEGIHLNDDQSPIMFWSDQTEALGRIYQAIFRMAYPDGNMLATFHAAAASQGKSVLLSGLSGAGKSTLAAYLASRGWRYYGDDVIGLNADGTVAPLPCALSLKEGSWQVLRARHPVLDALAAIHYGGKTARYLPLPTDKLDATEHQTLAAWVFPCYQARSTTRLETMTVIESLQALINNGMALDEHIDVPGIRTLLRLLSDLPRYSLVYSSLDEASACLQKLIHS